METLEGGEVTLRSNQQMVKDVEGGGDQGNRAVQWGGKLVKTYQAPGSKDGPRRLLRSQVFLIYFIIYQQTWS